ncbi:MAG: hypothetical protein KY475_18765, partial [Planctomycetes bacterium]|nr:hypothetical protein [Planctomycetota bacterium]
MRFSSALIVGLALASMHARASSVFGQDAPTMGGLAWQTGWVAFGIADGRLAVLDAAPKSQRSAACVDANGGTSESLCVQGEGAKTALRYEFVSPQQRLSIEAGGEGRVELHRAPLEAASLLELHLVQAPGRDVVLTIGAGSEQREFSAPDFWRLVLAEPDVARDCLTPLLETLRADWNLRGQTAEIEARLFALAASTPAPDTARWKALVAQLGERSFLRRQAAERQLRAAGPAAAPFLAQLDRRTLDPEQLSRLRNIRETLHPLGEDTPARVAARLV